MWCLILWNVPFVHVVTDEFIKTKGPLEFYPKTFDLNTNDLLFLCCTSSFSNPKAFYLCIIAIL